MPGENEDLDFLMFDPTADEQKIETFQAPGGAEGGAEGGTGADAAGAAGAGAAGAAGAAPETVPKADYDALKDQFTAFQNEMRGFMAAQTERRPVEQPPQPPQPPQPAQTAQDGAAALRARLKGIGDRLVTEPETALEEFLGLTAQISAAQAQQYASGPATTATDLIIENFLTRKSARDPLYEKIADRINKRLENIDPRALSGYSRAQLNQALEEVYDAEAGRWAREQYTESQKRRAPAQQQPPNLAGGKSGTGGAATGIPASKQISDEWRDFARRAGIPEDQIEPMFAATRGDE